jgi:hypothetical protein
VRCGAAHEWAKSNRSWLKITIPDSYQHSTGLRLGFWCLRLSSGIPATPRLNHRYKPGLDMYPFILIFLPLQRYEVHTNSSGLTSVLDDLHTEGVFVADYYLKCLCGLWILDDILAAKSASLRSIVICILGAPEPRCRQRNFVGTMTTVSAVAGWSAPPRNGARDIRVHHSPLTPDRQVSALARKSCLPIAECRPAPCASRGRCLRARWWLHRLGADGV